MERPLIAVPESAPILPREEYVRRLEARLQLKATEARRERLVGNARVIVFLLGAALAWPIFGAGLLSPWWLLLPAVVFVTLLVFYDHIQRAYRRAVRAAAFYEKGLARLDDRWSGIGEPGSRFLDGEHPNAVDLDLFGPDSLFQLLCTARTRTGEETLATWLRAPAAAEEIRSRQEAVTDLRPRLDLREDLGLLGGDGIVGVDLAALARWGAAPPLLASKALRIVALFLAALNAAGLAATLALGIGLAPFLIVILFSGAFALWLRVPVGRALSTVERRARDLGLLAGILARLEQEQFTAARLQTLRAALETAGQPPSRRIAQLATLVDRLDWKRNVIFAPVAFVLMWDTQLAFAIEAWRATSGPAIARWLAGVGEFEALCALAGYAYEHPADPFPEITTDCACFDGVGLGHPLLPQARCVRNDLHLGGEGEGEGDLRLLIVSGSNMSGKSTLLRTVGVNAVLALAGAPVRAHRLRLSPLVVGATLRIQDSLQAGKSRFYAEITRVRQLVDLARGAPPLLFLLDELFSGTNSHDRCLGAEGVVRKLIDFGAIGLITTHDLTLAGIADRMAPHAANVHFEDRFENGAITFDYLMRPGVVQKSNALALMRAVGLEI